MGNLRAILLAEKISPPQLTFNKSVYLNCLRSRISDINLGRLMRIAIEGPQLTEVNFHQILDIYKQQSHNTIINHNHRQCFIQTFLQGGGAK